MKRFLLALWDQEKRVKLAFDSLKSSKDFRRLSDVYFSDHAPGNGYGALLALDARAFSARKCKVVRQMSDEGIEFLEHMVGTIAHARHCTRNFQRLTEEECREALSSMTCENLVDCIRFRFDESKLPPRQRPGAGDLALIVDNPEYDRVHARIDHLSEDGTVATLQPVFNGNWFAAGATLPIEQLMKVEDCLYGSSGPSDPAYDIGQRKAMDLWRQEAEASRQGNNH